MWIMSRSSASSFLILFILSATQSSFHASLTENGEPSSLSSASPASTASSSNGSSLFTCPEQFGYYDDRSDCTKYFVCVFGEALHESCTGGLYFSAELQTCDWPRNVRCGRENKTSSHFPESDKHETEPPYDSNLDPGSEALLNPSSSSSSRDSDSSRQKSDSNQRDNTGSDLSKSTPSTPTTTKDKEAEDLDLQRSRSTLNKNFVTNNGNTNFNYLDYNRGNNGAALVSRSVGLGPLPPLLRDNSTQYNNNIHLDVEPPLSTYDETSSTVVDSDGGIHLPDGRGGLYGISSQLPGLLSNSGDDKSVNGYQSPPTNKESRSISEPGEHRSGRSHSDVDNRSPDDLGPRSVDRRRGIPHYQLQALRQAQHFRRGPPIIPVIVPKQPNQPNERPESTGSSARPALSPETKRQDYDAYDDGYPQEPGVVVLPINDSGNPQSPQASARQANRPSSQTRTRPPQRNVNFEPSFVEYIDNGSDRPEDTYYDEEKVVVDHYNQARTSGRSLAGPPIPVSQRTTPAPIRPPQRSDQSSVRPVYPAVPRINSQPHFRPFVPPYAGFEERRASPVSSSHRHQRPAIPTPPEESHEQLPPERPDSLHDNIDSRPHPSVTPSPWDYSRVADNARPQIDAERDQPPPPPTRYIPREPEPITTSPRPTEPPPPPPPPPQPRLQSRKPQVSTAQAPSSYSQPGSSVSNRSNRPQTRQQSIKPIEPVDPQTSSRNRVDLVSRLPTGSGVPSEHGQPFGLVDYDDELASDQRQPVPQPPPSPPQQQPPPPPQIRTRAPQITTTPAPIPTEHKPASRTRVTFTPIPSQPPQSNSNSDNSRARRPKPTNKRLTARPAKSTGPPTTPARPNPIYPTVQPFTNAVKCDPRTCRLPDCNCGSPSIPGGLKSNQVPQIVMITFDDAINDLNWEIYEEIFNSKRKNPNGCPLLGTFYVSHEWTDYGQVQTLYSRGHEMASHGVTHSFGEKFSTSQWHKEIHGQREILHLYGGVKMEDVRGMRAPFLQIGGNKMFQMLYNDNFTYDSSMPVFDNKPPFWPYTLDYAINHECMIAPCPSESFPGVWEVGMVMWEDLRGGRCSMGDACSNPSDEDGVYNMLLRNFKRHYNSNRAPFGLYYHSAWFNTAHHRKGFMKFMDEVLSYGDVYFTTKWQMLQWVRNPTPLSAINSFEPWDCNRLVESRPGPCSHPTVCNVRGQHGHRFMKTCQSCPSFYPWVGKTGL